MTRSPKLPLGIKVIIAFHLSSFVVWFFGQSMAVVFYDQVAGWGLQEPRDLVDPVIVEVNRAIGLSDTLVMLPLLAVAALGLSRRKFYGAVASWMVFGMTLYWPIVFWASLGFYGAAGIRHAPLSAGTLVVPAIGWLIALWGSWHLYRSRELFR